MSTLLTIAAVAFGVYLLYALLCDGLPRLVSAIVRWSVERFTAAPSSRDSRS